MRLFISWSGDRSEALAKALYEWLPLVLHYTAPWLSKSDIKAGERWSLEVAKELEQANFGILCVTKDNLNSPWILFEAGALAKSMQDGRVIPLLLDLDFKEVSGPLAQFQAKKTEKDGIWELVTSLNKAAPTSVPDPQLEKLFSALWDDLSEQIAQIPSSHVPEKSSRPQGDILEELVSSVRNVEMRVRDAMDEEGPVRRRRRGRSHPMMILELLDSHDPQDPLQLLVIAGLLRDDLPWIYEVARSFYEVTDQRDPVRTRAVGERLLAALELARRGPFIDDALADRAVHTLNRLTLYIMELSEHRSVLRRRPPANVTQSNESDG